jgi:arylsulfatase A-like enzyme
MVICLPAARKLDLTLSSHADIFPTLFDWMGAAGWDSTRLTGRSLLESSRDKVVVLAGAGFPTQAGAFAMVTPEFKFWLHLNGPDLQAVILDRVTDALDRPVPITAAVRQAFNRARFAYLRGERAVLRVN